MTKEDSVNHTALPNGVHVVIKRRANLPLVSIAIGSRAGSAYEPRDWAGVTAMMARASIKGTSARSAAQIAEEAEAMGGSVSPTGGNDLVDWEISVPSRHFSRAFDLVADVAFDARFPEDAVEVERKLMLSDLQQAHDDMYRYPMRLCMQEAFAGHPYGTRLEDMERGVTRLASEQLGLWRDKCLRAEPWVFVVGDVDTDATLREIERRIPAASVPAPDAVSVAQWQGRGQQNVELREKAQSALAIAFPGPGRNDDDVHAIQVLSNAVGGLGGRFFEELRSKRSLAYSVALMPVARVLGGMFVGYIATSPEREAEARAGLLEQFELLKQEPLPDEEVARAIRYTVGTWQIRYQTNAAQLNDLLQAHLLGNGMREITEFEDRIRAVTPQRILEVAQRYIKPELAVEGVIRGTGKSR
jgi:zinc protease